MPVTAVVLPERWRAVIESPDGTAREHVASAAFDLAELLGEPPRRLTLELPAAPSAAPVEWLAPLRTLPADCAWQIELPLAYAAPAWLDAEARRLLEKAVWSQSAFVAALAELGLVVEAAQQVAATEPLRWRPVLDRICFRTGVALGCCGALANDLVLDAAARELAAGIGIWRYAGRR